MAISFDKLPGELGRYCMTVPVEPPANLDNGNKFVRMGMVLSSEEAEALRKQVNSAME